MAVLCILLSSFAAIMASAQPLRGPGQMQLVALAEEAIFLAKHHLLPSDRWSHQSLAGGRHLRNVDSIPGQGACQFKDGECIVDGKYFAKVGALLDLSIAVQALDVCTSFDNFDGSCNDFVNPPGVCKTVFMGPVVNGLACVPVNSTAGSDDFETGFDIQPTFGSLRNFLESECPEFSVLEKTSGPICNMTYVSLLRVLGCETCIMELEMVQGPVAAECGQFATLETCISDEATAAARFVLCGDDPTCARVSPNSVDNPLDRFYGYEYVGDYNTSDYNSADYPAPGPDDYSSSGDYAVTGDYSATSPADYLPSDYQSSDYQSSDYQSSDYQSSDYQGAEDGSPGPSGTPDYGITGFDYGFTGNAPIPVADYGAAYSPAGYYDYSARAPDVRDILDGYLFNIYSDPYDAYAYAALPVGVDEPIFYGHEPFVLAPGNPWEGEDVAAPPIRVPIPEKIKNITATAQNDPVVIP